MSAYGTQKVPTTDLNVGFPLAFSRTYARFGKAKEYIPDAPLPAMNNTEGDDFQAMWHEQKKRDAHYMAGAKVKATHAHNARAFSSPHGYFMMPAPVLGQRQFANTSLGSLYTHSTRDDQPSAGAPFIMIDNKSSPYESKFGQNKGVSGTVLEGGVLRTSAGQRYGRKLLEARIKQLNAINEAKQGFASGSPTLTTFAGAQSTLESQLSSTPLVELANLLQTYKWNLLSSTSSRAGEADVIELSDRITGRDAFQDMSKMFPLLVRLATANPPADIANVLEFISGTSAGDGITQLLSARIGAYEESGAENVDLGTAEATAKIYLDQYARVVERLTVQLEWWNRMEQYLREMLKIAEQPAKTRENASHALIASAGFSKLQKTMENVYRTNVVPDDAFIDTTGHINNYQNAQRAYLLQGRAGKSGAFINPYQSALNTFSNPAQTRENAQQGYDVALDSGRGRLEEANKVQNAYAYGSGENQDNTGGRPRAWGGEEEEFEYGEAPSASQLAQEQQGTRASAEGAMDTAQARANEALALQGREGTPLGSYKVGDEYDIKPPPKVEPPAGTAKRYRSGDVPSDRAELIAFIRKLERELGARFRQSWAEDTRTSAIRRNTINKLRELGLLETGGYTG